MHLPTSRRLLLHKKPGFLSPTSAAAGPPSLQWPYVTPKFLFGFFKKNYLTWREWFKNFSSRELSLSYIFFMATNFIWIHPRSTFDLGGSCFSFGLKTKWFSFGKITFEIFLRMHYGSWKVLCHFQLFLLAMTLVQILSPNPSLTFGSWFASNPASWTSPCDHFHSNSIQINFCPLL